MRTFTKNDTASTSGSRGRELRLQHAEERVLAKGLPFDREFYAAAIDDLYALLEEFVGNNGAFLGDAVATVAASHGIRCIAAINDGDAVATIGYLTLLRTLRSTVLCVAPTSLGTA